MAHLWTACFAGLLLLHGIPAAGQALSRAKPESGTTDIEILPETPGPASGTLLLDHPQSKTRVLFTRLASDQERFWTSPKELKKSNVKTVVPFAAFTGLLIASDGWLSKQVPDSPGQLNTSRNISNYTAFSLVGGVAGTYLLGNLRHDDHLKETGILSGEAMLNSIAIAYASKGITQRPRPLVGNGNGDFFSGGYSFPSLHSALAWSVAGTVAHEYPGPLTKALAYGVASTVTLTRVTSKQHFPSDVVVGSALGWYVARQVYRAHHDHQLSGTAAWGTILPDNDEPDHRSHAAASPYTPLESWTYAAFDRLAALGYVKTAFLGQRPWTRIECARLMEEAGELIPMGETSSTEAAQLYRELSLEFAPEAAQLSGSWNPGIRVESVYQRTTLISGQPLRDSFHFGQTIVNDYGRPYAEGVNSIAGALIYAEAGPFAFSARTEYQHAPSTTLYSQDTLRAIANADGIPEFSNPTAATGRLVVPESMAAVRIGNVQLSFGTQIAWLSPARSGSLLLSNNAEPFPMLKIDSVSAFRIPLLSRVLGPARTEFFLGQLSGHQWIFNGTRVLGPQIDPQPYLHGQKISFKPTSNLEFGMGVTAMFSGPGLPFTWNNFLRTYYSHRADIAKNPGKRFSAFDFSYRVPHLRKWLTLYADSLVVDEVSPIGSTRPSFATGLYFPQIPIVPRLELRVEGLKTSHSGVSPQSPGFVYADRRYLSGYTNEGTVLGGWIGRAAIGGQAWATYHWTARNSSELSYRHMEVDHAFLEGGRLNDFSVSNSFTFLRGMTLSSILQYETWQFPIIAPSGKSDVRTSFQLEFNPRWRKSIASPRKPEI